MNGETSLQSSDPILCANGCGFFGSPATNHLCSKCFKDLQTADAKFAVDKIKPSAIDTTAAEQKVVATVVPPIDGGAEKKVTTRNRCGCCNKKVGITGFACRCGVTFCGTHRYPEEHDCNFDYKGKGKEAIAKANPIVKADKIQRF